MGRTADRIFDDVVGLCFWETADKADYQAVFVKQMNVILAECFDANNSLRRKRGKAELKEIPEITELEDSPGYEDYFERMVIPYGVASLIYVEDDESGISNVYRAKYMEKLNEYSGARFVSAAEDDEEYEEEV